MVTLDRLIRDELQHFLNHQHDFELKGIGVDGWSRAYEHIRNYWRINTGSGSFKATEFNPGCDQMNDPVPCLMTMDEDQIGVLTGQWRILAESGLGHLSRSAIVSFLFSVAIPSDQYRSIRVRITIFVSWLFCRPSVFTLSIFPPEGLYLEVPSDY